MKFFYLFLFIVFHIQIFSQTETRNVEVSL